MRNNRWYPLYHVAAPTGWINDPNGFCTYKGQYHLFYQYHPYSAQWGPMHWGHVVSKDFVHWEHLPVSLKPDQPYDRDGCFSGSAIEFDGLLYLLYTGNVPEGQKQCLAVSDDGINFEKYEGNPVIEVPQDEDIHPIDFRDPKVWRHGKKFYAVIGSKTTDKPQIDEEQKPAENPEVDEEQKPTENPEVDEEQKPAESPEVDEEQQPAEEPKVDNAQHGQALLYESTNLIKWKFKSISARGQGNQGNMWECPNFAKVDGKDVLIISPMGIEPEGNKFLNHVDSGYFIGKLDYKTGVFTHGDFELLDYGSDFYAPQIMHTEDGRCIMIGWLAMWYADMPEQEDGWAGLMTVPRELHIRDGKLIVEPVKELETLRKSSVIHTNLKLMVSNKLYGVRGDTGELLAEVDVAKSGNFAIELRAGETEKTVLEYDKETSIFSIDRENSGVGPKDKREVNLTPAEKLKLRIYLDRSSIEVFINDGEAVMSARIYPAETSQDIIFVPRDGELTLDQVIFYKLSQGIAQ